MGSFIRRHGSWEAIKFLWRSFPDFFRRPFFFGACITNCVDFISEWAGTARITLFYHPNNSIDLHT
jgi:hypothetical protein